MTQGTTKQTETTLVHHLQSLGGGQLEAVLSDYAEDSVIFTADGTFKGMAAIRAFFEGTIKNTPPGMMEAFSMIRQEVEGEIAYILWKAEPFVPLGTDTFVVRGGKIVAQTFTGFPPS